VGTYQDLVVGDRFETATRLLDDELLQELIGLGGYTHPLFVNPEFAERSPLGRTPFPGQALLLIMGGLVEQSGKFDETTIALVGFDGVRFRGPAFAGDEVRVLVTVVSKEVSSGGSRGVVVFGWEAQNARAETIVEAKARMLFDLRNRDSQEFPGR
jgi:acyl dehydratase